MIPFVVGHFFLFCNIFRVRRSYELTWGVILLINAGFWFSQLRLDCLPVSLTQSPFTLLFVTLEIRSASYHGIFASRLNPNLSDYLALRQAAPQRGETPKPGARTQERSPG